MKNLQGIQIVKTLNASISSIIGLLPEIASHHARTSDIYKTLNLSALSLVAASDFTCKTEEAVDLGCFGQIVFPFTRMGAVSTLDLFGLDELIIFAFYWVNRDRYRRSADIGANLGLHSILMGKCGWQVTAYEPDPDHATRLLQNLEFNKSTTVKLAQSAVSDRSGNLEFVRVLGNTTSSHLAGAKDNAYGELEKFSVEVEAIAGIMERVDFIKMDAEGQEKTIILGTETEHWRNTDMILEVGTKENAYAIYDHLKKIGVRAFAQKLGWAEVMSLDGMPTHYTQGSLFLTQKSHMFWG
ncbi:FkbM family methyltransferase [Alphaproteobacteria bacterium]|nr:FkbM family methyltransferase [Alphaproteobacteria bacterium]